MNEETIRIIHGNFFEEQKKLEAHSFDGIYCDPPFDLFQSAGQDWDVGIDWEKLGNIFHKLLKPDGQVVIWSDYKNMLKISAAFPPKLCFRGYHVARRSSSSPSNKYTSLNNNDFIQIFYPAGTKVSELAWNPWDGLPPKHPYEKRNLSPEFNTRRQKKSEVNVNKSGKRWITTVIDMKSKPNQCKLERSHSHVAAKEIACLRMLMRIYSNVGDSLLIPFAGVGSELIAGFLENRMALGFELNDQFYSEGVERIKKYQAQGDLFQTAAPSGKVENSG
ncbi:MAG: hypothetical protein HQ556_01750 [Candidatus Marinimicrobia bacterium]|nr:hypothetical protein [Candidatus Neomarinimicrobiota bacterium]